MVRWRSVLLLFFLVAGVAATTPVQAQQGDCPGVTSPQTPKSDQQLTVSTTSVGLTVPAGTTLAVAQVQAQPIRYRDPGTPTATVGHRADANTTLVLCGGSVGAFRAIREGATDATLQVTFYGIP
jgi:hypothetical protein